jgi:hypothetical protein
LELAVRCSNVNLRLPGQRAQQLASRSIELYFGAAGSEAPTALPSKHELSLLFSCIKLSYAAAASAAGTAAAAEVAAEAGTAEQTKKPSSIPDALQPAIAATAALKQAAQLFKSLQQPATAADAAGQSSTANGSEHCQGFMLAGRSLVAVGTAVSSCSFVSSCTAAESAESSESTNSEEDKQQTCSLLAEVLQGCQAGVEFVQGLLPVAVLPGTAEARDSMQQKLVLDLQKLTRAMAAMQTRTAAAATDAATACAASDDNNNSSSSNDNNRGVLPAMTRHLLGLGQQLVACGEALAALCPVPLCCNNPGCVELLGASELQLVAGKGSQCSLCRWVLHM